ncbi:MAG: hypothetical protein JSS12_10830, partial [Verrucomicrobia bacterium]|nr:hypothetical protein [Verrucomicrobiota bacterium]
ETLASFPPNERTDAAALLKPILGSIKGDTFQVGLFLAGVQRLPQQERLGLIESAMPLLVTFKNATQIVACLQAFQNLEASERDEVAATLLSLFPEGEVPVHAIQMVERLGAERQRVLQLARPLFDHYTGWLQRLNILRELSPALTEENMRAILPLLAENVSSGQIAEQIRMLTQEANFVAVQSVKLRVTRQDLEDSSQSLRLLDELVTKLRANPLRQISVEIAGEPGIDASGLGREFVSKVVEGVIKEVCPELPKNGLVRTINGQEKAVGQLGELMMFCLNAQRDYPIGMVFDHSVFAMVTRLKPYHFDRPLNELDKDEGKLQELVGMYVAINEMNDSDAAKRDVIRVRQFAAPFTEETDIAVLKDVYYSAGCEYDDESGLDAIADEVKSNPAVLKQHLASLQTIARELVREMVEPDLVFARELALGMKASPFAQKGEITFERAQALGAKELAVRTQGELSADLVLTKLEFEFTIPDEKQEWVREWIRLADKEKLERFVFALTGSYSVGQGLLRMHNGENINFHTCFNSVNLPFFAIDDKEMFVAMLEGTLAKIESYNRS